MNEDDLDAQTLTEKLARLKSLVEASREFTDEVKQIALGHLNDIWAQIAPPRNENKLSGSINYCRALFFGKAELWNALAEVSSLFEKAGIPIEKGPVLSRPQTQMKKKPGG